VWECGEGQTHRQTDAQTRVTNIHFTLSTTHTKYNNEASEMYTVSQKTSYL